MVNHKNLFLNIFDSQKYKEYGYIQTQKYTLIFTSKIYY